MPTHEPSVRVMLKSHLKATSPEAVKWISPNGLGTILFLPDIHNADISSVFRRTLKQRWRGQDNDLLKVTGNHVINIKQSGDIECVGRMTESREAILKSLEDIGVVVIPNILTAAECGEYADQFLTWYKSYGEDLPLTYDSIIHQYRVSYFDATWRVRLKAKSVFSQIWGTEKLLSSLDGIAIGEPPELGRCKFDDGSTWFHLDHARDRRGVHIFQGAVYLEEVTEDDHCLRVLEGTHKFHEEFLKQFPDACVMESGKEEHFPLNPECIKWFQQKGCLPRKVAVPKGGIVLWDSRIVHDTVCPIKDRTNSDRWRFIVFVSMTPAIWAKEDDYKKKAEACDRLVGTGCFSSRIIQLFESTQECTRAVERKKVIEAVNEMPPIGRTRETKLLVGLERYDFDDGEPNCGAEWNPRWA